MAEKRRVQTRGQITLIATPDYKVALTPPNVMIPVADDGGSFSGQTFTQTITFKATDNLNQPLTIIGVSLLMDNNETLKIEDKNDEGLYYYTFTKTNEELKKLPDSGQLTFYVTLENESIGAEDDFVVDVSFSYAKAKSGRDGTPAYGVKLWTDNQIFIKTLEADGYQYTPSLIILNTTLVNCDNINVVYKWYHISSGGEEELIQQGTSAIFEVSGREENLGMYRVEIYNADVTPNIFLASDILGLAAATDGSESFTVLLDNDSEIVSVDREDYTISAGEVSTGIQVLKGAEKITDFEVILGDEDNDPHKEKLNNVDFIYYPEEQVIKGTYDKGVTIGEKLKITIKVGEAVFTKYFYVKASLAGESAKMIKVTGPQFFQVDAQGFITPDSIQLTANPQNIKDLWGWFYYDNEWILIPQGNLSDDDYKFLTITSDDEKWKNKNILEIKAAVYEMDENGNISFNDFYQDTYPIYKNIAGKDSYSVIPSNDTINIITNAFGQPVETRDYPINLKVFSGTTPISFEISEIGIAEGYSNPFIKIETNLSEPNILIKVDKEASQNTEFYNTPINVKVKINGIAETITKTIYLQPAQQGADAKRMSLSGPQVFRYNNATDGTINYNPTSTTIICQTNIDNYAWSYKVGDDAYNFIGSKNTSLTINPIKNTIGGTTISNWNNDKILTVKAYELEENSDINEKQGGIFDEITIYKVRDGSDGSDSIFAYPLNPSIIFTENTEGNIISQTITCQIASFVGAENKVPNNEDVTLSNHITDYYTAFYQDGIISITTNETKAPILEEERVGEINCTVILKDTKDKSHTFDFSINWTIIKGGVDGNGIDYINNYYYAMSTNDETSLPAIGDAAWKQKVTDTTYSLIDMYLWNYEEIKFTKNDKPTTTEPFIIGVYGKEGRGIKSFTTYYKVTATQKPQPSLPSGPPESDNWYPQNSENIEQNSDYPFLWSYELVTYDNGDTEKVGPRLVGSLGKDGEQGPQGPQGEIGPQGPQGESGEDGKTIISITSYYIESNSNSNPPTLPVSLTELNGWSLTASLSNPNYFIWTIDYLLYSDNFFSFTNARLDLGARSDKVAQGMYDGTFKLSQLVGATMTNATLNKNDGLIIEGLDKNNATYKLEANSNSLGIYRNNDLKFGTYTDNIGEASILLKGTIYADKGKIGTLSEVDGDGWTIQGESGTTPAAIYSGKRSSLENTSGGVYIGTDGISLKDDSSEEAALIYSLKNNTLKLTGDITANNIEILGDLNVGKLTGFDKTNIRTVAGFYSGADEDEVRNIAKNGDVYIRYSSGSNTTTTAVSVSSANGTQDGVSVPSISKDHYVSERKATYNGVLGYWNAWKETSSSSGGGTTWAKVGYITQSDDNGSYRGTIVPVITGGTDISKMTISFTGAFDPINSYDSNDNTTPRGIISVGIYDGTNKVGAGSLDLSTYSKGSNSGQTFTVTVEGSFSSRTSDNPYHIIMKGGEKSLIYVKNGTMSISGTQTGLSGVSAGLFIKSNNNWAPLTGEGGIIEDQDTTYNLSGKNIDTTDNKGYQITLNNEDDASASTSATVPVATTSKYGLIKADNTITSITGYTGCHLYNGKLYYKTSSYSSGNGIDISDLNAISISKSAGLYGYESSSYGNQIIFRTSKPTGVASPGDICFVYEV